MQRILQKRAKSKFKFFKKRGHPRKMIISISKMRALLRCLGFDFFAIVYAVHCLSDIVKMRVKKWHHYEKSFL